MLKHYNINKLFNSQGEFYISLILFVLKIYIEDIQVGRLGYLQCNDT